MVDITYYTVASEPGFLIAYYAGTTVNELKKFKPIDITINPITGNKLDKDNPLFKEHTKRVLHKIQKDTETILSNYLRKDELEKFVNSDKYPITLSKMKEMGYVMVPYDERITYSTYDKSIIELLKYKVGYYWTRYEETSDRPRLYSHKAMVDHYSYQMYIDEFYDKYIKNNPEN